MSLYAEFRSPEHDLVVVVEETARVAYAYLMRNQQIVAGVWLWNLEAASDDEWRDPVNLPFRNLTQFMSDKPMPLVTEADLGCSWATREDGIVIATLNIHDQPFARLWPGAKPGRVAPSANGESRCASAVELTIDAPS